VKGVKVLLNNLADRFLYLAEKS